ncbi:Bug family tripartite tricarboxylate transporter substrate binding protein [Marinimicrococcus flavescens]|uniref:Tripartite tricarboxylate transporter substrate binding protein n=1 Tax=Marinimicrococcus flavescens TaxID=3031815 RepID=A0AAP3UZ69_9PROT|nr:tripartite tricarboxylate transporter substrate binding protein [Marinimicrococcus flavescens]
MPRHTRRATLLAGAALTAVMTVTAAMPAQAAWPEKPVTFLIPWPAGGATDIVGRALQPYLAERLGTEVIIKNVVGAGGTIGAAEAARAKPDGYTLFLTTPSVLTSMPHMRPLPYDPKGFVPIGRINDTPMVVMVTKTSPHESIADIVEDAKGKPGELTYASTGAGTLPHITMISLQSSADVELKHVPFKGSAEVMKALLGDVVDVFSDQAQLIPRYDLRPLGVWAKERLPEFPDVPTMKEQGYDQAFSIWLGLFGPEGTPDEVVQKMSAVLEDTLEDPAVVEEFKKLQLAPGYMNPGELADFVESEYERNKNLMGMAGIKKQ